MLTQYSFHNWQKLDLVCTERGREKNDTDLSAVFRLEEFTKNRANSRNPQWGV